MSPNLTFEICVDSVESAITAQNGGADRVEFCDNLFEGGTTPSAGAIETARRLVDIKLHVIIRPRGGDFLYSDIEFEIMKRDVEIAKELRVDGIVIGFLNAGGSVDIERTVELTALARPMSVTFHRAFDVCREPSQALEDLVEIGIDRVLTSGQQPTAIAGAKLIESLVEQAEGRISIMACGSLDEQNIADVVRNTGVHDVHFTAFEDSQSKMEFRSEIISMGREGARSEYIRRVTSLEKVRNMIEAARASQ